MNRYGTAILSLLSLLLCFSIWASSDSSGIPRVYDDQKTQELREVYFGISWNGGNRLETARKLLTEGADINAEGYHFPDTFLHAAVQGGSVNFVQLFIDYGAHVNAQGLGRATPLHLATCEDYEICRLLIKSGANLEARMGSCSEDYWTPLLAAARFGAKKEICELLINSGADVYAVDERGKNGVDLAKEQGYYELADYIHELILKRFLIDRGVDVNSSCFVGWSPLLVAAWTGERDLVDRLVSKGADLMTVTADGKNAAEVARDFGHAKLARYIGMLISIKCATETRAARA